MNIGLFFACLMKIKVDPFPLTSLDIRCHQQLIDINKYYFMEQSSEMFSSKVFVVGIVDL